MLEQRLYGGREDCGRERAFAEAIRKCLEAQTGQEFILQIPLRKEVTESEKKIRD